MEGAPADLEPGDYTIVPAEWRRDLDEQVDHLTTGTAEGDDPVWHLYDVEDAGGTAVLEIADDRRGMEGALDTTGRQFLFRSPDGAPCMAMEREGAMTSNVATLRALPSEEVLGRWEQSPPAVGSWQFTDAGGTRRATVERERSLSSLTYPEHVVTAPGGSEIGRFAVAQDGMFYRVEVTLERSAIPPGIGIALAYGISWATSEL